MKRVRAMETFAGTPLTPEDATRLVANICEITRERLPTVCCSAASLTRIFDMGVEVYEEATHSEIWNVVVAAYLDSKSHLRPSSRQENRYVLQRLLRVSPELGRRLVCSMRPSDCQALIERAFVSVASRERARKILHCFFNYALRRNWCRTNPVDYVFTPKHKEETIHVLTLQQVGALLKTVTRPEFRACAAAVGIMLWAGVRPMEVARLHWSDVDVADGVISVISQVSKTGGARMVRMEPVLKRWLQRCLPSLHEGKLVAPPNWVRRWKALRRTAGLEPWQPDTLRHTYASYHLRYFGDIYRLQLEMGHSNAKLLLNRYLNMRGLSADMASLFWNWGPDGRRRQSARRDGGMQPCVERFRCHNTCLTLPSKPVE